MPAGRKAAMVAQLPTSLCQNTSPAPQLEWILVLQQVPEHSCDTFNIIPADFRSHSVENTTALIECCCFCRSLGTGRQRKYRDLSSCKGAVIVHQIAVNTTD